MQSVEKETSVFKLVIITGARLMGQYCLAGWLASVVVCNVAGVRCGPAGRRASGRSGDRHSTAGQYGYVPLWRRLVYRVIIT